MKEDDDLMTSVSGEWCTVILVEDDAQMVRRPSLGLETLDIYTFKIMFLSSKA